MRSRRHFLQQSGLAASSVLLLPWLPKAPRGGRWDALPYGLFFDAATFPAMQGHFSKDPLFAGLRERLAAINRGEQRAFLESGVRYNDHLSHIKQVSDLAQQMAFIFLMTADEDAAALSVEAVETLMRFPKWDYFLEAGEHVFGLQRAPGAVMAVSLAADWLGDSVKPEDRTRWLRTMGERGCEACFRALYGMRYPDRVVGWSMDESSTYFEHRPGDRIDLSNWPRILDRTNLKAVPAAALAVGTAAYRSQFGESDAVARWLEQAVFSLSTFRDLFARDGSYDEGVSYANYTTTHLAQATTALQRVFGTDLYDLIDWTGYVQYLLEMSMPTREDPHAIVNFGDAGAGATSAVPFWVADRTRDVRAQWVGQTLAREHDEWSLIWYSPRVPATPPPAVPHLWQSDLDWIVARDGYAPDDLVVALRSGGPANHEHADRGGLILKCFGEQLVADPYRPPYSFSDPAWMMRTTAGHSALLIDGQGHQYHDGSEGTNASEAAAKIIRAAERDGYALWTSDATPAYQLVLPDVQSVTRTVVVLYAVPAVLVLDKVVKGTTPSLLQARFFGYNLDGAGRVEASADGFRTVRPGAVLEGRPHAPGGGRTTVGGLPIPEETAVLHPFAEVATREAHLTPLLITALLPERGSGGHGGITFEAQEDDTYTVSFRGGSQTGTCSIADTGTVPEVSVMLG